MLEQCGFVSWRQQDSAAVGREHSRAKKDHVHFETNEWKRGNYILRTKRLECSQLKEDD